MDYIRNLYTCSITLIFAYLSRSLCNDYVQVFVQDKGWSAPLLSSPVAAKTPEERRLINFKFHFVT